MTNRVGNHLANTDPLLPSYSGFYNGLPYSNKVFKGENFTSHYKLGIKPYDRGFCAESKLRARSSSAPLPPLNCEWGDQTKPVQTRTVQIKSLVANHNENSSNPCQRLTKLFTGMFGGNKTKQS